MQGDGYYLAEGAAAFEDGTVNYLSLPAVEIGLRHINKIGVELIHRRVMSLTGWLLEKLLALRHANGELLVRIYGPTTPVGRGATITLNMYGSDGRLIDYRHIEQLASQHKISLRTGCFCNPGAGEVAHGLTQHEMQVCFKDQERMTFEQFLTVLEHEDGKSAGAIRVSLGLASNFEDVCKFVQFAAGFLNKAAAEV